VQHLVKILYEELKKNLSISDDIKKILTTDKNYKKDNDFFHELEDITFLHEQIMRKKIVK